MEAAFAENQRREELLPPLNAMIQEANRKNKVQKSEYIVIGALDVRSAELTVPMLEMIVAHLETDAAITDVASLKASRKFAGKRGTSKVKLVERAVVLLPPTARLETGGLSLPHVLETVLPVLKGKIAALAEDGEVERRADQSDAECALLARLGELEKKKSKRLKKKLHPKFRSVDTLQAERLSTAQTIEVLGHLGVPVGEKPKATLAAHFQNEENPMQEFAAALQEAIGLASDAAAQYVSDHNRLVRLAHENYGPFSKGWKVWWVRAGIATIRGHTSELRNNTPVCL